MRGRATIRGVLTALLLLAPAQAFAIVSLTCNGAVPSGELYETSGVCTGVSGIQNIFSGLVCNYQGLLNDIMSRVYCGIQFSLMQPLRIALVIYVVIFGLQMTMGMIQMRIGEFVSRLLRLTLVWVFASNASYGIGIAYNFFFSAMTDGIDWVLGVALPSNVMQAPTSLCQYTPATGWFSWESKAFSSIDYLICKSITGPFTASGAMVAGFMAVLAYIVPPAGMMFIYFIWKTLAIFTRALISYLVSTSAIVFLITLSPIFLSLALFKPTVHFFHKWLNFMASFVVQVVLIFAGVALWITVALTLSNFFDQLATMIRPVNDIIWAGATRSAVNSWGICNYNWGFNAQGAIYFVCGSGVIYPSRLITSGPFLYFLILNLVSLCTVAYAFDTLISSLPGLARELTSAPAPAIGGGGGAMGAVQHAQRYLPSLERAGSQSRNIAQGIQQLLGRREPAAAGGAPPPAPAADQRRLDPTSLERLRTADPTLGGQVPPGADLTAWTHTAVRMRRISQDANGFFLTPVQAETWRG